MSRDLRCGDDCPSHGGRHKGMAEQDLQDLAGAECDRLRLLWHHCPDSRRCGGPRGFPDLVALGPGGLLIAELKGPDGETSPEQDLWSWTAHTAGLDIPLFQPADQEELKAALRGLAVKRS